MQIADPSAFGNAGQGRTAGELQLQLGDELEPRVPVRRQLHVQQAERLRAERQHGTRPRRRSFRAIPTGNILGSLTTIAQEGGFGAIDTSHRSMTYLSPSMTVVANRLGSHEFRGGADLYPNIENETSTQRRRRSSTTSVRRAPPAARMCSSSATRCAVIDGSVVDDREQGLRACTTAPTSRIAGSRRRRSRSRPACASRTTKSSPQDREKVLGAAAGTGRADQHLRSRNSISG